MIDIDTTHNSFRFLHNPAWRYYLKFYRPFTGQITLSIFSSLVQSIVFLPVAWLIRYSFDVAIPAGNYLYLVIVGLAIILLQVVNDGAALWTRHIVLNISKKVIRKIREETLNKFFSLSRSYYSKADQGELHTIIVQDTERVDVMTNALLAEFIPMLLISLVLSLVLAFLNWYLFLIVAISLPLLALSNRPMGKTVRKMITVFHTSFENFSKGMLAVLQMMDLTRLSSAEESETERQIRNFKDLQVTSGRMAWFRSAYGSLQTTFMAVISVIILIVGGQAIARGYMTVGDLITFYAIMIILKPNTQKAYSSLPFIIEGNESLKKIYRLISSTDTKPYSGKKKTQFEGNISLESVSFAYIKSLILNDITITFPAGSMITIIGPNGSGKTTLANLILGFYRPQKGKLYADNQPYNQLDITDLRCQIGVVSQDPIIFHGTILENIQYGFPDADFNDVFLAAELSTASEFIKTLPAGYDTFVGENGLLLSGGQRQRIAIARAFLRKPKLLILDEPTNNLDSDAVNKVLDNIMSFGHSPTIITISHDINIARMSDSIYVLENGIISDQGNYSTLFPILEKGFMGTSH